MFLGKSITDERDSVSAEYDILYVTVRCKKCFCQFSGNRNTEVAIAFLIFGNHGGSWHAMLQKYSVGTRLPIRYQVFISNQVVIMYRLCEKTKMLKCIGEFQPDIDKINKASAKYNEWAKRMIEEGQIVERAEIENLKL